MIDCSKYIPEKCKADCCGIVPISLDIWETNLYKVDIAKIVGIDRQTFKDRLVPVTADLTCVFLNSELMCSIYEDRPIVCREFGEIQRLKCPHIL